MQVQAYLNRIATAVPDHEINSFFNRFAATMLPPGDHLRATFSRLVSLSGIANRYSCFAPADDPEGPSVDAAGTCRRGAFPGTAARMEAYKHHAPMLAQKAVEKLLPEHERREVTHLVLASCTGFSAPGVDLELVRRCGLDPSVERTLIGFMGCYAAINALKTARHIVRSEPQARVLVVTIELCTLHLRDTSQLEELASFCLWGDGCAAALVTAEATGFRLDSFHAEVDQDMANLMTWDIRDNGFEMVLSGQVPGAIRRIIKARSDVILGGQQPQDIALWAVHPGGRSVLDAVERGFGLTPDALAVSRSVLHDFGNMSSTTVMFVLERMMGAPAGAKGCAMAFGPGLTAETMLFESAG